METLATKMSETTQMVTKRCSKCGRTLPVESFAKSNSSKDGYQGYCKECKKEFARQSKSNKKHLIKIYSDPQLATFTPRQLLEELKSRGYHGTLKCTIIKEAVI